MFESYCSFSIPSHPFLQFFHSAFKLYCFLPIFRHSFYIQPILLNIIFIFSSYCSLSFKIYIILIKMIVSIPLHPIQRMIVIIFFLYILFILFLYTLFIFTILKFKAILSIISSFSSLYLFSFPCCICSSPLTSSLHFEIKGQNLHANSVFFLSCCI